MQVTAHLQSLRIAPRKVRLMANLIKGMDASVAKHQLAYFPKRSSLPIAKLLESALANAQNNFGLVRDNMKIKEVIVNGGQVLKRFEPKGFGSVSPHAKRTSHVTIVLEEKVPGLKSEGKGTNATEQKEDDTSKKIEAKHEHDHEHKPAIKKEIGKKEGAVKKVGRKIFQRKSI